MSGRHRRAEPDPLTDVDVAEAMEAGPVVQATATPVPTAITPDPEPERAPEPEPTPAPEPAPAPTLAPTPMPRAAASTVVARRDRAAERAARRRAARRRRLLLGGAALVVVLVVAAVGGWLLLGRGDDTPAASTGNSAPHQATTLVQVTGADGTAAASSLLGTTKRGGGAVSLLVPSRLSVNAASAGDMPFGEAVTLANPNASADALTDLLGVSVKDSWVLSKPGLAALVDAVGGVRAAVDVDVVETDTKGDKTVVVKAGTQQLKGPAAASYATYLADGEPEQARLARFDEVLTGAAAALPKDPAALAALLTKLGAGSRSTAGTAALADRLEVMRAAAANGSLVRDVLPVTEIDTGGTSTSFGLDASQATAKMASLFPGNLTKDANGETLRVLVENGVGTPGLVEKARTKLVDAGFRFVNGGNASPFSSDPTEILVPDGTDESIGRGNRVAQALGLPTSEVVPADRGQTVADVIVILGKDFTP